MSEDSKIHFWDLSKPGDLGACGLNIAATPYTFSSPDWPDVNCGECLEAKPAESREQKLSALLAEARATEERALAEVTEWSRIFVRAVRVRELLEAAASPLSAPVSQDPDPMGLRDTPHVFQPSLPEFDRNGCPVADWGRKPLPY